MFFRKRAHVENVVAMPKFMQSLNQENCNRLRDIAKSRGITVQEFIRAVIIPERLKEHAEK